MTLCPSKANVKFVRLLYCLFGCPKPLQHLITSKVINFFANLFNDAPVDEIQHLIGKEANHDKALACLLSWYLEKPVAADEVKDLVYETEGRRNRKVNPDVFSKVFGYALSAVEFKTPLSAGAKPVFLDPKTRKRKRVHSHETEAVPTPHQRQRELARYIMRLIYPNMGTLPSDLTADQYLSFCKEHFGDKVPKFMTEVETAKMSLAEFLSWLLGKRVIVDDVFGLMKFMEGSKTLINLKKYEELFGYAYNGTCGGVLHVIKFSDMLCSGCSPEGYVESLKDSGYYKWQEWGGPLPTGTHISDH